MFGSPQVPVGRARSLCFSPPSSVWMTLNSLPHPSFILQGGMWYGVDVNNEDIADNFVACVWEPAIVRINALTAASEAACLILSVDETIKNPRSGGEGPPGAGRGRGRGRPHAH